MAQDKWKFILSIFTVFILGTAHCASALSGSVSENFNKSVIKVSFGVQLSRIKQGRSVHDNLGRRRSFVKGKLRGEIILEVR